MDIISNKFTEYYLVDINIDLESYNNNNISKNINKELFYKWFQFYTKNYSNHKKEIKIYKKIIDCRYTIIQENIKPVISYQLKQSDQNLHNSSNQNLMNYIQKYNEYYEDIHIPNIKYLYEYYTNPQLLKLAIASQLNKQQSNKNLFLKNNVNLYYYNYKLSNKSNSNDIDLHNPSINDPTDMFEINEVIINLYEEQLENYKYNIKISFCIVNDCLQSQSKYFWIKYIVYIDYNYDIENSHDCNQTLLLQKYLLNHPIEINII